MRCHVPKKMKTKSIAPVPLARPKTAKAAPGELHEHKLCTTPTDGSSLQCELTVSHFSAGTCEEWSLFCKNLNEVIEGLNLTTGTAKFKLAHDLLTGNALSIFNAASKDSTVSTSETNKSFEACLDSVAHAVFPAHAELRQKRCMHRSLEKPDDVTMREFMSHIQEINECFPLFPLDFEGNRAQKHSELELVKVGKHATPEEWQNAMHPHNTDPLTAGVSDFIKFCEHLETLDDDTEDSKDTDTSDGRKCE